MKITKVEKDGEAAPRMTQLHSPSSDSDLETKGDHILVPLKVETQSQKPKVKRSIRFGQRMLKAPANARV